jgi:glycosyltransferase
MFSLGALSGSASKHQTPTLRVHRGSTAIMSALSRAQAFVALSRRARLRSMKISVITVSFNSASTIVDTLRSINQQTHQDIEHIVIDGASADDTVALVRRHGHRVAHLVTERDLGIYDAMNKGLALASGDYVGFLNADDVFARRESVARIVAASVSAGHRADAIYGDLVYVRANDIHAVIRRWRSGDFRHSRLRWGWMPPHPTFYVQRELMLELGGFDIGLRVAADYDFELRCLKVAERRVAYVPEVLVRMRVGGVSNRSLPALWRKSSEDLAALRRSGIGGVGTLMCKNLRKVPQFLRRD